MRTKLFLMLCLTRAANFQFAVGFSPAQGRENPKVGGKKQNPEHHSTFS